MDDSARAARTGRRTRIQEENRERILAAALTCFAEGGYSATTIDRIAKQAGMSKPNLLYYFSGKEAVYRAVLDTLIDQWLASLRAIDPEGAPLEEIARYIRAKLAMSAAMPEASRVFASEIIAGAPVLGDMISGTFKALVEEKANVIARWRDEGLIAVEDPRHLLFAIWATSQHYADFDKQVVAILGEDAPDRMAAAERFLTRLFTRGLAP